MGRTPKQTAKISTGEEETETPGRLNLELEVTYFVRPELFWIIHVYYSP